MPKNGKKDAVRLMQAPTRMTTGLLRDQMMKHLSEKFRFRIYTLRSCAFEELPQNMRVIDGEERDRRQELIREWFSYPGSHTEGVQLTLEDVQVKGGRPKYLPLQIFFQGTEPFRLIDEAHWDDAKLRDEDGLRRIRADKYGKSQVHICLPEDSQEPVVAVLNINSRTSIVLFTDRNPAVDGAIERGLGIVLGKRFAGLATERRGREANLLLAAINLPGVSVLSTELYNTEEDDKTGKDDQVRIMRHEESSSELVPIELKTSPDDARRFVAQRTDEDGRNINVLVPPSWPASFRAPEISPSLLKRVFSTYNDASDDEREYFTRLMKRIVYGGSVGLHALDRVFAVKAFVAGSRYVRLEHPLIGWLARLAAEGVTDLWWFEKDTRWTLCKDESCPCRAPKRKTYAREADDEATEAKTAAPARVDEMPHGWRLRLNFFAPNSQEKSFIYVLLKEQKDEFRDLRPNIRTFTLEPELSGTDEAVFEGFRALIADSLAATVRYHEHLRQKNRYQRAPGSRQEWRSNRRPAARPRWRPSHDDDKPRPQDMGNFEGVFTEE